MHFDIKIQKITCLDFQLGLIVLFNYIEPFNYLENTLKKKDD